MAHDDLQLRIEAVLMTADRPLGERKLASILDLIGSGAAASDDDDDGAEDAEVEEAAATPIARLREGIEALNDEYERSGRSFRIERVAGGLQILTLPAYSEDIARLKGSRQSSRLSQAALETLAIIAYRQPILRADLESIRGVACGEVLRSLMERRLVRIAGRAEELGRPMLYGTTREFLEVFGLASLDDLPNARDLRPVQPSAPKATKAADETNETDETEATEETGTADVVEEDACPASIPAAEPASETS